MRSVLNAMEIYRTLLFCLIVLAVAPVTAGGGWSGIFGGGKGRRSNAAEVCEATLLADPPAVNVEHNVKTPEEKTFVRTTFKANRSQTRKIEVMDKDLLEFFLSEASREHILQAHNFEQIGPNTFRCEMEPIQFFSASIVPVLDINVDVDAAKNSAVIHAVSRKVKKSEVQADTEKQAGFTHKGEINEESFQMDTRQLVTWIKLDDKTVQLTANLSMEISMEKPHWLIVPNNVMNRMGSMVLQQVLKKTLPDFLDRIEAGYTEWGRTTTVA